MKKKLFILFMIFSISTVFGMEDKGKEKEKGGEGSHVIHESDLDEKNSKVILQDISKLLETHPTNNPKGLVTSYIFNECNWKEVSEFLKIMQRSKDSETVSDNTKHLSELIYCACADLIAYKAFYMARLNGMPIDKKFRYCADPGYDKPAGWLIQAEHKDPVYKRSKIPLLEILEPFIKACVSEDSEKACVWLDSLELSNGPLEQISQSIMAINLYAPKNSIEVSNARYEIEMQLPLKYLPNSSGIVVGTSMGKVILIDLPANFDEKMNLHVISAGDGKRVTALDISSNGKWLSSGSVDKMIRLYDLKNREQDIKFTLARHADEITAVAFLPSGDNLFAASKDKTVTYWDAETRHCLDAMPYSDLVSHVVVSPDNHHVAACSGKTVYFIDPRAKKNNLGPSYDCAISGCGYSPDGSQLAVVGNDANGFSLYDIRAGKNYHTYVLSDDALKEKYNNDKKSLVYFSPCGTKIFLGYGLNCAMFDLINKDELICKVKSLVPHYGCNFAPDGKEFASVYCSGRDFKLTLQRQQLYNEHNEKLGKKFTAQTAIALKFMEKAATLKHKVSFSDPLMQRIVDPQVRNVLQTNS